ncbi:MAG: stage V sporulation protein AD [Oscillospiraceae bacterium]|nr:stage V sporulation protein AD [Oscillospiraceae bacterium]
MIEYESLLRLDAPPSVSAWASIVGKKEGEGPLGACFDIAVPDLHLGMDTWEQAESELQRRALLLLMQKEQCRAEDIRCLLAGDLINQCTSSTYAMRSFGIPFLGIYGACSTFAEGLLIGGALVTGIGFDRCAVVTSSHFSSAERQYRFPLSYGGQRTPNAQWTCTAAGAAMLTPDGAPPYLRGMLIGRIRDAGITDANNMGAAMAPAAADTLLRWFSATGTSPGDYDAVVTGDLGAVGSELLYALLEREGCDIRAVHRDCGKMIFEGGAQDTHAGGSGCGCSASVICGWFLPQLRSGEMKHILYAATGALLTPMRSQQGESIPSICHLVHLSHERSGRV